MLSKSQIDQYHENGYLIPDFRLSDDTLNDIKSAHAKLIELHPEYVDYCPAILPHDRSFVRFARNDDILDMVSQIIGANIALWNSSFFAKPARVGSATPWHQDGEYWPMRPLANCTVWIAVMTQRPRTAVCMSYADRTKTNACSNTSRTMHPGSL